MFDFKNAEDSIRKSLYQRKIAPPGKLSNYMPMEEGVSRMRKGLFAFHMETGAGYKLVSKMILLNYSYTYSLFVLFF